MKISSNKYSEPPPWFTLYAQTWKVIYINVTTYYNRQNTKIIVDKNTLSFGLCCGLPIKLIMIYIMYQLYMVNVH